MFKFWHWVKRGGLKHQGFDFHKHTHTHNRIWKQTGGGYFLSLNKTRCKRERETSSKGCSSLIQIINFELIWHYIPHMFVTQAISSPIIQARNQLGKHAKIFAKIDCKASPKVRSQRFMASMILSRTLLECSSQSPSEEYWMAKSIYWVSHDFLSWPSHSLDEWCGESVMHRPWPMWYLPIAAQTHVCQSSQTLHYLLVCVSLL